MLQLAMSVPGPYDLIGCSVLSSPAPQHAMVSCAFDSTCVGMVMRRGESGGGVWKLASYGQRPLEAYHLDDDLYEDTDRAGELSEDERARALHRMRSWLYAVQHFWSMNSSTPGVASTSRGLKNTTLGAAPSVRASSGPLYRGNGNVVEDRAGAAALAAPGDAVRARQHKRARQRGVRAHKRDARLARGGHFNLDARGRHFNLDARGRRFNLDAVGGHFNLTGGSHFNLSFASVGRARVRKPLPEHARSRRARKGAKQSFWAHNGKAGHNGRAGHDDKIDLPTIPELGQFARGRARGRGSHSRGRHARSARGRGQTPGAQNPQASTYITPA